MNHRLNQVFLVEPGQEDYVAPNHPKNQISATVAEKENIGGRTALKIPPSLPQMSVWQWFWLLLRRRESNKSWVQQILEGLNFGTNNDEFYEFNDEFYDEC